MALSAATLLVAGTGLAHSAEQAYECTFRQIPANGGWLAENVIFSYAPEKTSIVVYDGIIHEYVGHPIDAKISNDTTNRLTMSWTVKASSASNQKTTMIYRLTMAKADMKAMLTAIPQGYEGTYSAQGTCKKIKS